jgi:hypothetical protein
MPFEFGNVNYECQVVKQCFLYSYRVSTDLIVVSAFPRIRKDLPEDAPYLLARKVVPHCR